MIGRPGVVRFDIDTLPATPWKNGGGSTREIACWPPGATLDDFDWRVSVATIAASGPFSVFAGVERQIVLLAGDGVLLDGQGDGERIHARLDTPHLPFAFGGDVPVGCTLLGGASTDFNVMSRRERCRAEVRVFEDMPAPVPVSVPRGGHGLVLSLQGDWHAGGSLLTRGQGLWWADAAHDAAGDDDDDEWRLEPAHRGCKLIAVRWQHHAKL